MPVIKIHRMDRGTENDNDGHLDAGYIEELKMLRSEIIANSQKIRILAELLGMGDRFDRALLEYQSHQEADANERQQRRQEIIDSVTDTKD